MHEPLTAAELGAFHRDGYVVLPSQFLERELAPMRDAADRIFELAVNATLALERRYPRMDARFDEDGTLTLRKIQPVNDLSDVIAAIATDERLIAPMRQLMCDEPVLMEEKLNYKQAVDLRGFDLDFLRRSSFNPETGLEGFVLHHDWGYYRMQGYPPSIVSSAVALDDCAGRGPIRLVPGSHLMDVPMANPDPASGSGVVLNGYFAVDQLVPSTHSPVCCTARGCAVDWRRRDGYARLDPEPARARTLALFEAFSAADRLASASIWSGGAIGARIRRTAQGPLQSKCRCNHDSLPIVRRASSSFRAVYVLEPLWLHRWLDRRDATDPAATMRLIERMHRLLLTLSLVTIAGAVAGSHGFL